ncbi:MAG: hypothetical protein Q6362_006845 [Candidatus Wukongarchaeota archaeon]|nr:hypothetical protein [Candidatus Wukongarchaeota archaeon]
MVGKPIGISSKPPRILPTGYEDFDDYFKILSGTCTIFYVCNQTYWDPRGLLVNWVVDLSNDEFNIIISTRFDPITATKLFFEVRPELVKRTPVFIKDGRGYWIDMYGGRGLKKDVRKDIIEKYEEGIKSFEIDPFAIYIVKNPEKNSSIDELNGFIREIMGRVSKNRIGRIFVHTLDNFVDSWGMEEFLEFFKHQVDLLLHKFHHTGVYVISYKSYPRNFHAKIERIADNIILRCYNQKKEEKYMQILKSSVIDSFFGKVPYRINEKMLPELKLPPP